MPSRTVRVCQICGLAVGSYEPAVFIFGEHTIFSSRAARPGLSSQPGCRLEHVACHADHGSEPHLRLVSDSG